VLKKQLLWIYVRPAYKEDQATFKNGYFLQMESINEGE
jgi:hypothetical protein